MFTGRRAAHSRARRGAQCPHRATVQIQDDEGYLSTRLRICHFQRQTELVARKCKLLLFVVVVCNLAGQTFPHVDGMESVVPFARM